MSISPESTCVTSIGSLESIDFLSAQFQLGSGWIHGAIAVF
ncbi:MAG: hypothetical protein WCE94_02955 [Candidatus Methanoperedens sp.]